MQLSCSFLRQFLLSKHITEVLLSTTIRSIGLRKLKDLRLCSLLLVNTGFRCLKSLLATEFAVIFLLSSLLLLNQCFLPQNLLKLQFLGAFALLLLPVGVAFAQCHLVLHVGL